MLEKNEEAYDFVTGYPNRGEYMGKEINLTADDLAGQVPLLMGRLTARRYTAAAPARILPILRLFFFFLRLAAGFLCLLLNGLHSSS